MFEFICAVEYNMAVTDIMKCIRLLAERTIENGKELDFTTGFDNGRKVNVLIWKNACNDMSTLFQTST